MRTIHNSDHTCKTLQAIVLIIAALGVISFSAVKAGDANGPFPEISDRYNSKTLSFPMRGDIIDYGGNLTLTFNDGSLYRRRDSVCYDYYFKGAGRLNVLDISGLDAGWQHYFGNTTSIEFVSAYIVGHNVEGHMMLDPAAWEEDKLNREDWQELQFLVKAPDRYFWVDIPGELGLWLPDGHKPLPIWVDLVLADDRHIVIYVSPDVSEQMNVYLHMRYAESPYLLAGYNVSSQTHLTDMEIDSAVIAVDLEESGRFSGECSMFFQPGADNRGIRFRLPWYYEVDSVFDAAGQDLPYIKKKRRLNFYVAPRPKPTDGPDRLTVYYRGKFMRGHFNGIDYPVNVSSWFPHLPRRHLGTYTIHYTLHKDLKLISVGDKIGETIDGNKKTVSYRTDDISYISFAAALYDSLQDTVNDIPFTLYIRTEHNQGLFNRSIPQTVLDDLAGAFHAFTEWYGPPLTQKLVIVDQPLVGAEGQSSHGLIHLTQTLFRTKRGWERYRAHEVAHQWWGHTATPRSLRDEWLSEGLAECAAMYLLDISHDTTSYEEMIDFWRRQVLEEGKFNGQYSRGYRAGPIVLGSRLLLSRSPGDYFSLVYCKAGYMLEMLRFEMDGPDYKTDFFRQMLADYRQTYFNKQASSADFIGVVRKYLGPVRTATFFNQWLYDWRVPDISGTYAITPHERGGYMVAIDINVSDVSPDFETPYPIEIKFADGTEKTYRIDGVGQAKSHLLGPFPEKIDRVRFDPNHVILVEDTKVDEQ